MSIKGVIFDLDGVLIDSYENHYKAFEKICRKYDQKFDVEIFERCFGRANPDIFQHVLEMTDHPDELELLAAEKEHYYREFARCDLKIMTGAREVLTSLRDSYALSLATSTPEENVDLFLENRFMRRVFQMIVYGTDVKRGKPEPDIFLEAASRMRLQPTECVVVEDSVNGVLAAKNASMRCIALTSTHSRERLAPADWIIDQLREITSKRLIDLL